MVDGANSPLKARGHLAQLGRWRKKTRTQVEQPPRFTATIQSTNIFYTKAGLEMCGHHHPGQGSVLKISGISSFLERLTNISTLDVSSCSGEQCC